LKWLNVRQALVWCSVFNELGVNVNAADGLCTVEDILNLIKVSAPTALVRPESVHATALILLFFNSFHQPIRPYQSLEVLGKDSFLLQGYFLTHLFFILSGWGGIALTNRRLFIEVRMATMNWVELFAF